MNALNRNSWLSAEFVDQYRILDEEWLTKQALYQEMFQVISGQAPQRPLHVLDLGGGLGTAAVLAREGLRTLQIMQWVVFDFSIQMMQRGKLYHEQNASFAHFVQGNVLQGLPFSENTFDIVFALNVFYLFSDADHEYVILPAILRVLKPGGLLVICNPVIKTRLNKIIWHEAKMRSDGQWSLKSIGDVLYQVFGNLSFLTVQRQLVKAANTKSAEQWAKQYQEVSGFVLTPVSQFVSNAYAEQVSIVAWCLENSVTRF